jgi:hypothetical protein
MEKNLSPENNYEEIRKDIEESTEIDYLLDSLDIVDGSIACNVMQLTEVAALRTSELKTNACSSHFC